MGNCLKHPSSPNDTADDDEEWDCSPAKEAGDFQATDIGAGCGAAGKTTEVKIKITKKQLKALLGKADGKDLRVEHVLAQLMAQSDRFQAHQGPWRPALQSIPEVN